MLLMIEFRQTLLSYQEYYMLLMIELRQADFVPGIPHVIDDRVETGPCFAPGFGERKKHKFEK